MKQLDKFVEFSARALARRSSRRGALARLGALWIGGALPLLPVARSAGAKGKVKPIGNAPADDERSCEYWRYCALDGSLCSCCGGTASSCPPGTQQSAISWIGTCRNDHDGLEYLVSYNDCCGKSACGRCDCYRNEGELPLYKLSKNNETNWCLANDNSVYNCTISILLGRAS